MDKDIMYTDINGFLDYMFADSIEDSEGEIYLLFSLMYYLGGFLEKGKKRNYGFLNLEKKKDVISFNWITPRGWGFRKTYVRLFFLLKELSINAKIHFEKEIYEEYKAFGDKIEYDFSNPLVDRFINGGEDDLFFQEPLFLYLEGDIIQYCEIINDFGTEENLEKIYTIIDEKIALFVSGELSKQYGTLPFEKQKEVLLDKIAKFHNFYGKSFNLKEKDFWVQGGDNQFLYIYFVVFLWRFEYIKVFSFSSTEEIPLLSPSGAYLGENEKYSFHISLTDKLIHLIEGWIEIKSIILDKIFSDEYKQLTIKKKDGKPILIEGDIEYLGDETRFIELQKKYPHSKIEADTYGGKVNKYKIKEKIRLDKKQKEV